MSNVIGYMHIRTEIQNIIKHNYIIHKTSAHVSVQLTELSIS